MRLFYVPSDDARREMMALHTGRTSAEFVDAIWRERDMAHGKVKRSHKKNWPFRRLADQTPTAKITKFPGKKKAPAD